MRGYSSVTIRYETIRHPARKSGQCPVCLRKVVRTRVFTNTLSPYNRSRVTGLPATREEIEARLAEQAHLWVPDFTHENCRGKDS